jgi:ankyrin repeat protein
MAGRGRADIMKLLLDHGADTELVDDVGETPLRYAAVNSLDATNLLLEYGAAVDAPGLGGQTPLLGAAARGDIKQMNSLLAHGAQVNAQSKAGITALMCAARASCSHADQAEVVRLLLAHGADPDLISNYGAVAEHLAQGEARDVLVAYRERRQLRQASALSDDQPVQRRRRL